MVDNNLENIQNEFERLIPSERKQFFEAFFMAAMSSIPWVGGFISAMSQFFLDKDDVNKDNLQMKWMKEHLKKIRLLEETMKNIEDRFNLIGEQISDRIQSEDYLELVRKSFRVWDNADTDEKRKYVANVITNACATQLASDDVVRLFIDWLDDYHEAHFAVIREIFNKPGVTRYAIWESIKGEFPREDSAEADLFKMLIRDLSTGGVIRQKREVTSNGQFIKRQTKTHSTHSGIMESAFEDSKPYELTELGKQFVHYAITDIVPRLGQ